MTKMANVSVQIHKNISYVFIQCHNNLLTTPAAAGRQRISRQVLQKCNEGLVEEHRCWGWSGVHLLVSIDPENCKYCIFTVIKKELWSCLASRIILREPSATNTHKRESVWSFYFVSVVPQSKLHSCWVTHSLLPFEYMIVIHMSLSTCVYISNVKS